MATDYIFAYGSNMNRSELRSWLEAAGWDSSLIVDVSPATLDGYEIVWNFHARARGCGIANLEPKEGATVWGVLIEIEAPLLKAFDRKEGHPYLYSRGDAKAPVKRVRDGKTVLAWVYVGQPNKGGRKDVWPSREYKKLLLDAAAFWEFPEAYLERMRSWTTQ